MSALPVLAFDGDAVDDEYALLTIPEVGAAGCIELCVIWDELPTSSSPTQHWAIFGTPTTLTLAKSHGIGCRHTGGVVRHTAWLDDGSSKPITGGTGTVTSGTLYRYSLAWTGGTGRLVVSTVNLTTGAVTTTEEGTVAIGTLILVDNLYLGKAGGNALPDFKDGTCRVLDLRVWSGNRTNQEIEDYAFVRLNGDESGLVRYLRIDEGTGLVLNDETSNATDGAINDASWSTIAANINPFELSPGRMKNLTGLTRQSILGSGRYGVYTKFVATDGSGSEIDYSDYFIAARWTESVDQPVIGATVDIAYEYATASLAPLVEGSARNTDGVGGYAPAVWPARDCKLSVAVMPAGETPASTDYVVMWEGRIDQVEWAAEDAIRLSIRDVGGWLQEAFIDTETTYDTQANPLTDLLQDIVDDWPAHPLRVNPTVVEVDDPDWFINGHTVQVGTVMDALQSLVMQNGFDLRYGWTVDDPWALRIKEPVREILDADADTSWGPGEYVEVPLAEVNDRDVRTWFRLVRKDDNGVLRSATLIEVGSEIEYGRKFMQIAGPTVAAITTEAESDRMLNAVAADLSTPEFAHAYRFRFNPFVMLGDYYAFTTNSVHYDATQYGAVQQIEHVLEGGGGWSTVYVSGKPRSAYRAWRQMEDERLTPDILSFSATHSDGTITATATFAEAVEQWSLWARNGSSPLSSGTPDDAYLVGVRPRTLGTQTISGCEDGTWYLVLRARDRDDRVTQRTATVVVEGEGGGNDDDPLVPPANSPVSPSIAADAGNEDAQGAILTWVNTNSAAQIEVDWYANGVLVETVTGIAANTTTLTREYNPSEGLAPPVRVKALLRYTNAAGDGPDSNFSAELRLSAAPT